MAASAATLRMAGRIYWAFLWRVWCFAMAGGVIMGIVAAFLPLLAVILYLIFLVVYLVACFKMVTIVFHNTYPRFSITLIDNTTGEERPKRWQDTLRLIWSFSWRSMVITGIPMLIIFSVTGVNTLGKDMVKVSQIKTCNQQLAIYQKTYQNPQMVQVATQAVNTYNALHCQQVLTEAQQQNPTEAVEAEMSRLWLISLLLLIPYILIKMKIIQIIMGKRYQAFYVRVTPHEQAATSQP